MASDKPPPAPGAATSQFEQALHLHQQGRLADAAAGYQALLDQDPAHFDALHLLGMIAAQSGEPARAVALIDRALAVDPGQAAAHYHRALALRDLGQPATALAAFGAALERDPAHADAWVAHAETLQALQRPAEAVESYGRALALAPDNAPVLFARGILLQNMHRPAEALADYDRALALQPDFAGAINNRALVLQGMGRHAEALAGYEYLIALAPAHAQAHLSRGEALAALHRCEEALPAYAHALELQPDLADARLQRARALQALGQSEAALAEYERVPSSAAPYADACFERAALLQGLQRNEEALQSYDRALGARPDFAEARNNRALALMELRRPAEALAAYDQTIADKPDFAQAHANRGLALHALGRHEEARLSYERALTLRPYYAEAHANHGHALQQLRRLPEALAAYDRALAIGPPHPDYFYGRGAVLQLLERHQEALACYEQALTLLPTHAAALANRGAALRLLRRSEEAALAYAQLMAVAPDYPYVLGQCLHTQLNICDWSSYAASRAQLEAGVAAGQKADMPFHFLSVSDSAAAQRQCARTYARDVHPAAAPLWRGERYQHPRIRLAYVSGDLSFHPVSYLMAELLETHDRRRFEVTAISLRPPGSDAFDARIDAAFDHYIDASRLSDLEVARVMREHEIDIAIDLMGYTTLPRTSVYAHRPAPVQAAYLGYAGTLDTGYMDYLIADSMAIPPAAGMHYAEQVVRLPASFMPRDTSIALAPAPTRAAAGLPAQGFVFCCFNNAYKLNPPVFDVWMRLLRAVPGSVLWITNPGLGAQARLRREASLRGVAPERIVFASRTAGIEEHLGRLVLADLFLDTLPYNAHTTASDALWAGVPLLTCTGEAFASRVAASLLSAAGLAELITGNLAEYEALARQLPNDPARLDKIRTHLNAQRANGSLFNTTRLRHHLEAAYLRMYERSQQGLAPEGFTIDN